MFPFGTAIPTTSSDELKTLNVKGGVNANIYYENNISVESLKNKLDGTGIYSNKNVSIGWLNESSVVPLQIRNNAITNYNNSIIFQNKTKRTI